MQSKNESNSHGSIVKPKSIIDLVLEEQEVKQQKQATSSGNVNNSVSKESAAVLRADEAQLDIALNNRGKIFKERVRLHTETDKPKNKKK